MPRESSRIVALLRPRPDRKAMKATPDPRLIGPLSTPGGCHRFFQSNASAPRRMHSSSV